MMFGPRLRLDLALVLQTPSHVGTGRPETVKTGGTGGEDRELAVVRRDHQDRAIIPGTSLKGALRDALRQRQSHSAVARVFGQSLNRDQKTGNIGRLWIHAAVAEPRSDGRFDDLSDTSFKTRRRPDGYISTHVALSRQTGAADPNKLFSREVVGAGAVFTTTWDWLCGDPPDDQNDDAASNQPRGKGDAADIAGVAEVLAPLCRGICLGKGSAHGDGRITLDLKRLAVRMVDVDPQSGRAVMTPRDDLKGALLQALKAATKPDGPVDDPSVRSSIHLTLQGDGPFISMGGQETGADGDRNTTRPLRDNGRPVLWRRGVLGALRARAAWIAECERSAQGPGCRFAPAEGRRTDWPMDDRFLNDVLQGRREVGDMSDLRHLSSVERVFGVTGWRARIAVHTVEARPTDPPIPLTQVTIDRFTGGALGQRLFTTLVFTDVRFDIGISIDWRYGMHKDVSEEMVRADRALVRALIEDLQIDGIELGHGAGKGFGWFEVSSVTGHETMIDGPSEVASAPPAAQTEGAPA